MKSKIHFLIFTFFFGLISIQAQTTVKIKTEELPTSIRDKLEKKYSKYYVNGIELKLIGKEQATYEVELQKKNKLVILVFDAEGTLLNSRKSKIFYFNGTEDINKSTPKSNGGHKH